MLDTRRWYTGLPVSLFIEVMSWQYIQAGGVRHQLSPDAGTMIKCCYQLSKHAFAASTY